MSARLCGHGYDLNKQSCLFCEIDTWKSRAVTAETALAAAQAQVKELREALTECRDYLKGHVVHSRAWAAVYDDLCAVLAKEGM